MMNSPVSGRNQKPMILLKLKQALHLVSLVAFCIWSVYCIHHLHAHKQDYDSSLHDHIVWRKVNFGRFARTRSSDVERVVFLDITGNELTKSQEEDFIENGKGLHEDGAESRNPIRLVQENQVIAETSMHITRESLINERRSEPEVDKSTYSTASSGNDIAVVPAGLMDKNDVLTDPVYIHPKHHTIEEYHRGDVFDDENGVPPGLTESRNYE